MTQFETGEAKPYERTRIPDEIYSASFKGVRDIKDGKFGKRVAFLFEVEYEGKSVELAKLVYAKKATPKNDIGSVLIALGCKLDGKQVDTDKMIGTKCRVVVEDYEYSDNGQKKIASTISKVKPIAEKV